MALPIQYDFFEDDSELTLIQKEIDSMNTQIGNLRKGLFARHNVLEKSLNNLLQMYLNQQEEISKLRMSLIHIKNG